MGLYLRLYFKRLGSYVRPHTEIGGPSFSPSRVVSYTYHVDEASAFTHRIYVSGFPHNFCNVRNQPLAI